MLILYGPNRADGEKSGTLKEIRKQKSLVTNEDFVETIQDIDDHVVRNEVNLEIFDVTYDFSVPETQSPYPLSGSKRKKIKVIKNKHTNNDITELQESIVLVVNALTERNAAIREGNEIMRERQKYELSPISWEEIWNLINEFGCDAKSLPHIYCTIMKETDKLRMILLCPPEACKAVIMQMVFGSSD
ncbi:uncharacterized protein LOC131638067 [Vicia villosa]|uniref:uncharacterized protein LOC131638067 n=1 Tax=Vicia villosa TaxID=3911 RepID=UPI00273AD9D8|nr:uncharacterized protein LOC131638067 [Vicia villosa]